MIKLENIEFSYGNGFSLGPISLQIGEKDFLAILGPNGSGKSTLLKLISGYLSPSEGKVYLNERDISGFSKKELAKKISYVPQFTYSVFPYSVYEIVLMGRTPFLNFFGYENKVDREKVFSALEKMEISHLANKGINEISGGEAQRAFIARALVQETDIILMDEPNAHLDLKHQISIFKLLEDLNKEGKTILTVSHDLNLPGRFAENVMLIREGEIVKYGRKEDVLSADLIKSVFDVNVKTEKKSGVVKVNLEI